MSDRAAAAKVDADRRVGQMRAHLDRVLAELLRRGVATDLVPDWWRPLAPEAAADAEMRAGWPEHTALADRCRQLEELLHLAHEREDEAVRRMREAEASRAEWIEVAVCAGAMKGRVRHMVTIPSRELARHRAEESWRRRAGREGTRATAAEESLRELAAFVRRLARLPVSPERLPAEQCLRELYALADAVAPSAGPCALPASVVSDVCRLAAEYRTADIVYTLGLHGRRADSGAVRRRVLAGYGIPGSREATADGQAELFAAGTEDGGR